MLHRISGTNKPFYLWYGYETTPLYMYRNVMQLIQIFAIKKSTVWVGTRRYLPYIHRKVHTNIIMEGVMHAYSTEFFMLFLLITENLVFHKVNTGIISNDILFALLIEGTKHIFQCETCAKFIARVSLFNILLSIRCGNAPYCVPIRFVCFVDCVWQPIIVKQTCGKRTRCVR